MVQWHPTLSAESDRSAVAQVLRGLMVFGIGFVAVVSAFAISAVVVHALANVKTDHAEQTRFADLGLRHVCEGEFTTACVERVSRSAGAPVALARSGFGDVVVPVGTPKPDAVAALKPDPSFSMAGKFQAAQYVSLQIDQGSILAVTIYSSPTAMPAYGYRVLGTFPIDGVNVKFRTAPQYACKANKLGPRYCPTNVWASWKHNGKLYAANFVSYRSTVSPKYLRAPGATMQLLLPKIMYTDEQPAH